MSGNKIQAWINLSGNTICSLQSDSASGKTTSQKTRCVAGCCSVLQCAAVCCTVLQCAAVCCSVLQCVAACCSVLQCAAVRCSGNKVPQEKLLCLERIVVPDKCAAVCCSVLQCVAGCSSGDEFA